jgi:hypothetical protein
MRRRRMFLGRLCCRLRFSDSTQARSHHLCRPGREPSPRSADDGLAAHSSKQPLPVLAPPSIRLQRLLNNSPIGFWGTDRYLSAVQTRRRRCWRLPRVRFISRRRGAPLGNGLAANVCGAWVQDGRKDRRPMIQPATYSLMTPAFQPKQNSSLRGPCGTTEIN